MSMESVRCVGCGALVPDIEGPTHEYMESAPGCWHAYGEILAREYGDPEYWAVHRLTVDTYAVQHPGRPSPQSIQSVCVHLLSLCLVVEQGAPSGYALRAIQAAVQDKSRFTWLTPPRSRGEITAVDVGTSASAAEHAGRVREWATSAWAAWAEHHDTVRRWAASVGEARRV